jgi:hypothetical protein
MKIPDYIKGSQEEEEEERKKGTYMNCAHMESWPIFWILCILEQGFVC